MPNPLTVNDNPFLNQEARTARKVLSCEQEVIYGQILVKFKHGNLT